MGTRSGNCYRELFPLLVPVCSTLFSASMCRAGPRPGTDYAIFEYKTPSSQRLQAASSGRLGTSLPAWTAGGCLGLEERGFSQAGRLLAAESALALRAA